MNELKLRLQKYMSDTFSLDYENRVDGLLKEIEYAGYKLVKQSVPIHVGMKVDDGATVLAVWQNDSTWYAVDSDDYTHKSTTHSGIYDDTETYRPWPTV